MRSTTIRYLVIIFRLSAYGDPRTDTTRYNLVTSVVRTSMPVRDSDEYWTILFVILQKVTKTKCLNIFYNVLSHACNNNERLIMINPSTTNYYTKEVLSVCLFVSLSVSLSVCLSVSLSVCLSVFLSVCLSVFVIQSHKSYWTDLNEIFHKNGLSTWKWHRP